MLFDELSKDEKNANVTVSNSTVQGSISNLSFNDINLSNDQKAELYKAVINNAFQNKDSYIAAIEKLLADTNLTFKKKEQLLDRLEKYKQNKLQTNNLGYRDSPLIQVLSVGGGNPQIVVNPSESNINNVGFTYIRSKKIKYYTIENPLSHVVERKLYLDNLGYKLNKHHIVAITGIAGSGKTQLARYYLKNHFYSEIEQNVTKNKNIVIEISLYKKNNLIQNYIQFINEYKLNIYEDKIDSFSEEDLLSLINSNYSLAQADINLVVLFDNVDDPPAIESVRKFLTYCQTLIQQNAYIIITSQYTNFFEEKIEDESNLNLLPREVHLNNGLNLSECFLLFENVAKDEINFIQNIVNQKALAAEETSKLYDIIKNHQVADELLSIQQSSAAFIMLVILFDRLPLGLATARFYMEVCTTTILSYLKYLQDEKQLLLKNGFFLKKNEDIMQKFYRKDEGEIFQIAAISMAINKAVEQSQVIDGLTINMQDLLEISSFFSNKDIPDFLLKAYCKWKQTNFDVSMNNLCNLAIEQLITNLQKYSLISSVKNKSIILIKNHKKKPQEIKLISFHTVTQRAIRLKLEKNKREIIIKNAWEICKQDTKSLLGVESSNIWLDLIMSEHQFSLLHHSITHDAALAKGKEKYINFKYASSPEILKNCAKQVYKGVTEGLYSFTFYANLVVNAIICYAELGLKKKMENLITIAIENFEREKSIISSYSDEERNDIYLCLMKIYIYNDNISMAEFLLTQSKNIDKNSSKLVRATLLLGDAHLKNKEYKKTEKCYFNELINSDTSSENKFIIHYRRAIYFIISNKFEKALEECNKAIALNADQSENSYDYIDIYFLRAIAYIKGNNFNLAIIDLMILEKDKKQSYENKKYIYYTLGIVKLSMYLHYNKNNIDTLIEAKSFFSKCEDFRCKNGLFYIYFGICLYENNEFSLAIERLKLYLGYKPTATLPIFFSKESKREFHLLPDIANLIDECEFFTPIFSYNVEKISLVYEYLKLSYAKINNLEGELESTINKILSISNNYGRLEQDMVRITQLTIKLNCCPNKTTYDLKYILDKFKKFPESSKSSSYYYYCQAYIILKIFKYLKGNLDNLYVDNAIKFFNESINKGHPNIDKIHYYCGELDFERKKYKEALTSFREAHKKNSGEKRYLSMYKGALIQLGKGCYLEKDYSGAISYLKSAIELGVDKQASQLLAQALLGKAILSQLSIQLPTAIFSKKSNPYTEAFQCEEQNKYVYFHYVIYQFFKENNISINEENILYLNKLNSIYLDFIKQFQAQLNTVHLSDEPFDYNIINHYQAILKVTQNILHEEDINNAIIQFLRYFRHCLIKAYLEFGKGYDKNEDYKDAAHYYQIAIDFCNTNYEALLKLADIYLNQKAIGIYNVNRAINILSKVLPNKNIYEDQIKKTLAKAYYILGREYETNHADSYAIDMFNRSLDYYKEGYVEEARERVNKRLGNLKSVIESLESKLKNNPYDIKIIKELSETYFKRGKRDDFIHDYNRAIELDNQNAEAYFERGKIHFDNNNLTEAQKDFESAVSLNDIKKEHNFYLGLCSLYQNNLEDAYKYFNNEEKLLADDEINILLIYKKIFLYKKKVLLTLEQIKKANEFNLILVSEDHKNLNCYQIGNAVILQKKFDVLNAYFVKNNNEMVEKKLLFSSSEMNLLPRFPQDANQLIFISVVNNKGLCDKIRRQCELAFAKDINLSEQDVFTNYSLAKDCYLNLKKAKNIDPYLIVCGSLHYAQICYIIGRYIAIHLNSANVQRAKNLLIEAKEIFDDILIEEKFNPLAIIKINSSGYKIDTAKDFNDFQECLDLQYKDILSLLLSFNKNHEITFINKKITIDEKKEIAKFGNILILICENSNIEIGFNEGLNNYKQVLVDSNSHLYFINYINFLAGRFCRLINIENEADFQMLFNNHNSNNGLLIVRENIENWYLIFNDLNNLPTKINLSKNEIIKIFKDQNVIDKLIPNNIFYEIFLQDINQINSIFDIAASHNAIYKTNISTKSLNQMICRILKEEAEISLFPFADQLNYNSFFNNLYVGNVTFHQDYWVNEEKNSNLLKSTGPVFFTTEQSDNQGQFYPQINTAINALTPAATAATETVSNIVGGLSNSMSKWWFGK